MEQGGAGYGGDAVYITLGIRMGAVGYQVQQWLKTCGLSDRKLAQCVPDTRVYHDLGAYGDIAEGWMETLESDYGVDLNGFDFNAHFPLEFGGRNGLERVLLWLLPFAGAVACSRQTYAPVTLHMIDAAIRCGRWEGARADA